MFRSNEVKLSRLKSQHIFCPRGQGRHVEVERHRVVEVERDRGFKTEESKYFVVKRLRPTC